MYVLCCPVLYVVLCCAIIVKVLDWHAAGIASEQI